MITNTNFAPLSYSAIKIHGPDAEKYLQGQLTMDVKNLTKNTAQLTAHCNAQGRMVSLGYLIKKNDFYYYLIPQDIVNSALKFLEKFVIRSKVFFEILPTENFKIFSLWGDLNNMLIWEDIFFKIGPKRSLIFCDDSHYMKQISPDLEQMGLNLLSEPHWLKNQIEESTAWLDKNTQEKFLPDEIKLEAQNGVSFTKGCFIGQEIIARMHYLGHSKNHLQIIQSPNLSLRVLDTEPDSGGKIICQVIINLINYCLVCVKN